MSEIIPKYHTADQILKEKNHSYGNLFFDHLPPKGIFTEILGIYEPFPHVRMLSTEMGSINLYSLFQSAFSGQLDHIPIKLTKDGNFYYTAKEALNKELEDIRIKFFDYYYGSRGFLYIAEWLIKKEFESELVSGYYAFGKYNSKEDLMKNLIQSDFYKIKIISK